MQQKFDRADRLIRFASNCIEVSEAMPKTIAGNYLSGQLIRSSVSPAPHHSEACSAESPADFIHEMKVT